jgi:hypothetical protein
VLESKSSATPQRWTITIVPSAPRPQIMRPSPRVRVFAEDFY